VTEVGNGWYALAGNATDRNTLGELKLHATAATADPADKDFEVVSWDPFALLNVSSISGVTQTGGDLYPAVTNIAVTSAALNATASSRTITTGTGTGGVANTVAADLVYDNVADSAGTLDFYYEFTVAATNGAVGVGVSWLGYIVGLVNTLKVYAYNWGGATWDQVGQIVGIAGTTNGQQDFELTNAHTGTGGNLGLVRIRFSNTGLTAATVKTDRILLGYAVVQDITAIQLTGTQTFNMVGTQTGNITGNLSGSVGSVTNQTIRSGTAQAGNAATITLDASASATNNLYVGCTIVLVSGTGAGQARVITNYNGTSKIANVDRNWTTNPGAASVFAIMGTEAPALNATLQVSSAAATAVILAGTAQAGSTTNTIVLAAAASATNSIYVGDLVTLTGGTGLGQTRTIVSYNGTTKVATVDRNWTTTPNNTSTFNIVANITPTTFSDQGVAQAGASGSITLASTASAVNSIYVGSLVTILSGTDSGDTSQITAYNGTTKVATVSPNFAVAPDTTSAYAVIPTQSGTGALPGVQDVNVVSYGSTPVVISGGFPEVTVGGYLSGQDPATLWGAASLAACTGLPATNGQALTYQVQQRNNKEHADKGTGVITLYENDGTTPKSTQTYASTAADADRSAMA